ncbi:hypothetical protein [Bacteroides sp.]|uniref:sensor histidine kinase n=1 Tax=Bacteroides sp. TaxID=29523 RepID=UPI0026033751|nr:hypothetical protein [Bacteroides sp.]
MKRVTFLIFLSLMFVTATWAVDMKPVDKRACDSVIQIVNRMPMDSTRIIYMQHVFRHHRQLDWTIELLNLSLGLSRRLEKASLEISVLYDLCRYYEYRENRNCLKSCLQDLRTACLKYKQYGPYFSAWSNLLTGESGKGNTELVTIGVEQMKREADSLKYPQGQLIADIVLSENVRQAHQHDEALKQSLKFLELPELTSQQRRAVYHRISMIYCQQNLYDKAVEALDKSMEELKKGEITDSVSYRDALIAILLDYSKIGLAIPDVGMMKKSLEEVRQYYGDDWLVIKQVSYHTYWGGYYYLINDMPNCYKEFDLAAEIGKDLRITYMISVHQMKGDCAAFRKDYKVAALSYKNAVHLCYSINRDIARNNKEAALSNFKIRKALLEHEMGQERFNIVKVSVAVLLLIILLVVLRYIFRANKVLRHSEEETRKAWKRADDANRMKEIFLRTINEEIKEPIETVVDCADILSLSDNLSQKDRLEFSEKIKKHAGRLILLVNNVLDLSRLEAGMMKFSINEHDLVQLCQEAKSILGMQVANTWVQQFSTELDTLVARVDSAWFSRVLVFALSAPEDCEEKFEVNYTLNTTGRFARIVIHIPLVKLHASTSNERIGQDIARLYLKAAGGSYEIVEGEIVITYPL